MTRSVRRTGLFGRDSLRASEMALPLDPTLALGTLQTLADRQGSVVDPMSEEEPGKILHEVRLDVSSGLSLGGKSVYYGKRRTKAGRTPGTASTSPMEPWPNRQSRFARCNAQQPKRIWAPSRRSARLLRSGRTKKTG